MNGFSEELILLRETVRKIAADKIAPLAATIDEDGEFNRDIEALFWDMGLLHLMAPPEHGGIEADRCTALCVCVEQVAKVCASSALLLIIQAVASFPILYGGSGAILERYLPELTTGRKLAAYLVTEPGTGSDVAGITTKATPKDDGFVLNGVKQFATNGGVASVYSVLARTGPGRHDGLTFFVVDRDAPGVSVGKKENKLGQRGSNTTAVILEDVFVPTSQVLGEVGQGF